MNPDKQRIAIAEACGWEFQTTTREASNTTPINGVWPRAYKSPRMTHFEDCTYSQGRSLSIIAWGTVFQFVPDYLNDLNAMHEAEKTLTEEQQGEFAQHLFDTALAITNGPQLTWHVHHATAAQRAEALLRTLGKWEEA